jgi:hypothetical protein
MNAIRAPSRRLMKAKESLSFQHFLTVFHSCMDASNEENIMPMSCVYTSDYQVGGPTKKISIL